MDSGNITIGFTGKEKLALFSEWILEADVLVQIDARVEGVDVPANLQNNHSLTLKFSKAFNYPPEYDESSIQQSLKFGSEYHNCIVPWSAVWAMTADSQKGKQQLWHQDMPKEAATVFAKQLLKDAGEKIKHKLGLKKSKNPPPAQAQKEKEEPVSKGLRKKPNLKRIK